MKALIDPNGRPAYVASWEYSSQHKGYAPVYAQIPNASSVAEVQENSFEIASPLFWVDCAAEVMADYWYYENATQSVLPVPASPPIPVPADQPVTTGAQTL